MSCVCVSVCVILMMHISKTSRPDLPVTELIDRYFIEKAGNFDNVTSPVSVEPHGSGYDNLVFLLLL